MRNATMMTLLIGGAIGLCSSTVAAQDEDNSPWAPFDCEIRPGVPLTSQVFAYVHDAASGRDWDVTFEWTADPADPTVDRTITLAWSSDDWTGEATWELFASSGDCSPTDDNAQRMGAWFDGEGDRLNAQVVPDSLTDPSQRPSDDERPMIGSIRAITSTEGWMNALSAWAGTQSGYTYESWLSEEVDEDHWSVELRYTQGSRDGTEEWLVDISDWSVEPRSNEAGLLVALLPVDGDPVEWMAGDDYSGESAVPERITQDDVRATMRDNRRRFSTCASQRGDEPAAMYQVSFTIQQDGSAAYRGVEHGDDESVETPGDFQSCIEEIVGELEFPIFTGEEIDVTYPVRFEE